MSSLLNQKSVQRTIACWLLCFVFVLTSTVPAHLSLHAVEQSLGDRIAHSEPEIKAVIKGYKVPGYLTHTHSNFGLAAEECDFCFVSNALDGGLGSFSLLIANFELLDFHDTRINSLFIDPFLEVYLARAPPLIS